MNNKFLYDFWVDKVDGVGNYKSLSRESRNLKGVSLFLHISFEFFLNIFSFRLPENNFDLILLFA